MNLLILLIAPSLAQIPVVHGVLQATAPGQVVRGDDVALELSVPDRDAVVHAECTVAEQTTTFDSELLPAGQPVAVVLHGADAADSASCLLVARFANGLSERREQVFSWTWVDPDPSKAAAGDDAADDKPAATPQDGPSTSP